MEKPCIRLQFHFISEQPVRCVAMLPIISSPFRVSRMLRSWKAKRLSATSSQDACRVAQHFSTGSSVTRRNPDNRQICIPSNRQPARQRAEDFRVLTAGRAKQDKRRIPRGSARIPRARERVLAGAMAISILLPIVVRPPEANGPAEYLCAFFAGFARCIVTFLSDRQ